MKMMARFLRKTLHLIIPAEENSYQPHVLRRPFLIFFLAITLATEGFLVANLVARQSPTHFLAAVVPAEIIALTNEERGQNAAGNLVENSELDTAAQAKAEDMASKGYFAHNGPDGRVPWDWIAGAGYRYQYAGENLAVRFIDSKDVVSAWMASPSHRANIVKPVYTDIGVGVAQGIYEGAPATFVVQYFGAPLALAAPAEPPAAASAAASAAPAPEERVAGASLEPSVPVEIPKVHAAGEANSFAQSFVRTILRAVGEPQATSTYILASIAAVLLVALLFAFFMHVHVQSTNMLVQGSVVALFALSFLALNLSLSENALSRNQTASVALSDGPVIGEGAAVGYALFPH